MRRSREFSATVKHGFRTAQPDIVIHSRRWAASEPPEGPRVGFIVAKAVGSAVERHQVARRLRHVTRSLLAELNPDEQVVIRARPSSRLATSAQLEHELRTGLARIHRTRPSRDVVR